MAALQAIRECPTNETPPVLSRHEVGCLCVRLAECDELLQVAFLGADALCRKTNPQRADLAAIRRWLEGAERDIARARGLAEYMRDGPPRAGS